MSAMVKVAGVQMEPLILAKEVNLKRCQELLHLTKDNGAQLVIFPECTLTGYIYNSLDEAKTIAEPIPGPSTSEICNLCNKLNIHTVIGLIESDGNKYYNTVAFIGPEGLIAKYRKLHLPYLGVDRFLNHGNLPIKVHETDVGVVGMGICYDVRFPEHARVLALQGAELIVYPTNLADITTFKAEHMILTRAYENNVFCMSINRVGQERGIRFTGRSRIVDFSSGGITLAEGKPYKEDIIYAEIEPGKARDKYCIFVPGEFEIDVIKDRRPEYYNLLTSPLRDRSRIRQ